MSQDQSQPYDRALKSLLGDEVAEILPILLPGSEFVGEQNIEIDRTTIKVDLVYNVQYRGNPHILNMELQTDTDNEMAIRMLRYHVGLYDKHRRPVISMVIYPFETSIPESPFRETSGDEELLRFHYRVLPLWKLDAQQFVRDHVVSMYTLLPAMKGADVPLLLQAIEEMKQRYRESELGHHLVRFRTILRRSKTVSTQDKQEVEDHLDYYDSLLDQDPYLQQQKALERILGRTEGIQAFQDTIIEIVKNRFPTLIELAQQRVVQIKQLEDLKQLVVQLSIAADQTAARRLLMNAPTA
jgi:hypothetical protein